MASLEGSSGCSCARTELPQLVHLDIAWMNKQIIGQSQRKLTLLRIAELGAVRSERLVPAPITNYCIAAFDSLAVASLRLRKIDRQI